MNAGKKKLEEMFTDDTKMFFKRNIMLKILLNIIKERNILDIYIGAHRNYRTGQT